MKIAVYFDLPYGGAFRSMEEICNRLTKKHQITFFGDKTSHQPKTNRLFADFNTLILERIRQKKLADQIDINKFDLVFVTHDRHLQAPWILRYLKTKTVFLCQEPTRAFFEKFLDINPNLPFVNRLYETINRFLRKSAEIKNAQYATVVVANSVYSVESIFRSYGLTARQVYLGIDSNQFYVKNSKRQNQVVIVGNDEPQKGLEAAIESLSKTPKKIRPVLVIVSPRSAVKKSLIQFAKYKGVTVKNLYGLSPNQLCDVYNQSKLTLATAYLEPFGLSAIESMACGTPVVAVNEGGFRETVIDKKTGFLVERDTEKIAEAITSLITDKKIYQTVSSQAAIYACKYFSWDNTVKKIETILNETLKK